MPTPYSHSQQFLRFLASGVMVVAANFLLYAIFLQLHIDYLAANAVAFIVTGLLEFQINKNWVFQLNKSQRPSLLKFLSVNISMLAVSSAILATVVESNIFYMFPGLSHSQVLLLAKIPALISVSLLDYVLQRFFVFTPNTNPLREQ